MQEIINETGSEGSPQASPRKPEIRNIAYYNRTLAPLLDPGVLAPDSRRMVWYGTFMSVAVLSFFLICTMPLAWPLKLALSLILGFCNGTMGFICHEIYHGSVVKSQRWQTVLGFFGAVPFFITPTFWRYWHNRLHHGKTQQLIVDPDAFPTIKLFRHSKFMQFMFPFTPGSGHKRSYFYFFFWFSFHIFVAQIYLRFRNKVFENLDQKRVTLEFAGQLLIAAALFAYAGPSNWLWVFLIPLFVQNYVLMSYIATNHNLSPLTSDNDPLLNGLSVTNHPLLEYVNLNFGYHVEHHIFPTANSYRIKEIHELLKKEFPDTYKCMPKWQAIRRLYSTARIYKNTKQLINPETGDIFDTI